MNAKTITDIDVHGKRILVRVDFNTPLSSKNPDDVISVTDDARIRAALPTLHYLLERDATLILCSHLGRPKSEADRQFRMDPVARSLETLLGRPVVKLDKVVGESVTAAIAQSRPGDILLLENTRFAPGETKNNPELAQQLAALADIYVNDAFGSAHRAHASTEGVCRYIRAKGGACVAGFLMNKELRALSLAVDNPPHPYLAIMGGAKISDKIKLIENLLTKADAILIGGGMANTFFKALGYETGSSLVEEEAVGEARRLLDTAADRLVLPVDVVVADQVSADAVGAVVAADAIPADRKALDIGPATLARFEEVLKGAALVVWNGPMGVFEVAPFAHGTLRLAEMLADLADNGTQVIIGGGDSAAAVAQAGLTARMTHVSTGGGASLELLEGISLPGIEALDRLA